MGNGSNLAAQAANLLSPALRETAPAAVPRSDPTSSGSRSDSRGLVCAASRGSALPRTKLHVASQLANATVPRVRWHHPSVRALGGDRAAERLTLFVLGHCEPCKTTHGTEYRNSEELFHHVPTSMPERPQNHLEPGKLRASGLDTSTSGVLITANGSQHKQTFAYGHAADPRAAFERGLVKPIDRRP
jgi:hypothetical protein